MLYFTRRRNEKLIILTQMHQVYGPRDGLFLPNLLETAASGKLRIFGDGKNKISFCHVDNYCHGLMLGAEALYEGSPALGKFYVVTDDGALFFWDVLDEAVVHMGFTSLKSKLHLPIWLMMSLAHLVLALGNLYAFLTGTPQHIVNFHMKLNPFAVKMLTIHRHFNISAAKSDLKYVPIISFDEGWTQTKVWFKEHWLPAFLERKGKDKQS